jgi:catecholate siderophore receptor
MKVALLSASCLALGLLAAPGKIHAQSSGSSQLPPVQVSPPEEQKRRVTGTSNSQRANRAGPRRTQAARRPQTEPAAPVPFAQSYDVRTGTVGVYSNSTSVATKTNTPLLNIPQSVNVLTKEFIQDQSFQSITEATRYVPGVAIHQGEGNRDELVIRGVDSSANFFVNGFRDDVQYFRDLYNAQSVEVLKGPSALIFGRGAGGGLVNRTLKEADGTRLYEATGQVGSWNDKRVTLDAGQAVNENVAVRFNAMYENSDTFRQYGHLERYGINPTVTLKPDDDTKVKLSYEFYHDFRLADRGNPSQALPPPPNSASRFNPTTPFAPNGNLSTFFGSPIYNYAKVEVQTGMAIIDHDFGNGLTVRNGTYYADYNRGYRNVYPGGAVSTDLTQVALSAYQNYTPRENAFNQTDFTYKTATGPVLHTFAFGTEFGRQTGLSRRDSGQFPEVSPTAASVTVNPFNPTYFGPVTFNHIFPDPSRNIAGDANSKYRLNIASGYVQDQIEATRWLQFLVGARYDNFDMSALDLNSAINRNRVDDFISPRAAVIVKPIDSMSLYTAWSVSYLPSSGDQFSALNPSTIIIEPQRFESAEVGAKWNINPRLLFTAATYQLLRANVPINVGNGVSIPGGSQKVQGFETALTGYITPEWQSVAGYAYTDARITSLSSATIVPGNRVQLVPYNQFSWWNKYQFNPTWAAALGVIYFSDSFASSDDTVRLPGFVRFDAAVYAQIDKMWRVQLNVENIFNQGYWATADGNNNISPGQPRTVRLTAIAKF